MSILLIEFYLPHVVRCDILNIKMGKLEHTAYLPTMKTYMLFSISRSLLAVVAAISFSQRLCNTIL